MFRSPSGFKVSRQFVAAAVLTVAGLAGLPGQAQQSRRAPRETNANRRARIARQIADTYTHSWETGGGGGWVRFRSGQYLQKNSEITFWANTTYYLNQKLGITGEVRGGYGNAKVGNNAFDISDPQISEYPFLVGPTYRFRLREHTAWSAFALAGTAIGKFDGDSKGIPSTDVGMWPSTNARPAFSAGVNLDLNLYPNLAFRITPSYLGTTFGGTLENNAGFEMGLVFRFGRQK
jgi:type II secretory pathway pseudopilin PulG